MLLLCLAGSMDSFSSSELCHLYREKGLKMLKCFNHQAPDQWCAMLQTSSPQLETFQELLTKHPDVFHPLRTPKSLMTQWQLMKQYHLLPDQSGEFPSSKWWTCVHAHMHRHTHARTHTPVHALTCTHTHIHRIRSLSFDFTNACFVHTSLSVVVTSFCFSAQRHVWNEILLQSAMC